MWLAAHVPEPKRVGGEGNPFDEGWLFCICMIGYKDLVMQATILEELRSNFEQDNLTGRVL